MEILMITGDGAEALEVMYPLQRCQEAGLTVTVAAPTRKFIGTVVHDFEPGFDTYTEKRGYRVEASAAFPDLDPEPFAGLILPGGRAPEWIRNDAECLRLVRHFFINDLPVAAICHAALILAAADLLGGRTVTAYPALKRDVEMAGGTFIDSEVVVDGKLVTSRAWPDHPAFMREFLKLLGK
ncbi:DJ-1/PfpI family protein [bacterium]|nr:DJ-1/PfpI family protein [bacterium]